MKLTSNNYFQTAIIVPKRKKYYKNICFLCKYNAQKEQKKFLNFSLYQIEKCDILI